MILLVIRLVLGELVHAHDSAHSAEAAAGAQESSQCHDDNKQPEYAGDAECCETGSCECPCLFGAAVVSGVSITLAHMTESRATVCASGAMPDRLFTLFRPPASHPPYA